MKEIGGYFEFEHYTRPHLHEGAIALNCGRSALDYLIQTKHISKLYLPDFCCDAVLTPCQRHGVDVAYYTIQQDFRPDFHQTLEDGAWLYIVNFYGQMSNEELAAYQRQYQQVIVDQAHAYFQPPLPGVDTLYTCRKFFGTSDGGFLYTDGAAPLELPRDESFQRMNFVLGRFERDASSFYAEASANNHIFDAEGLKRMSPLTENLLRGVDYEHVKAVRTDNFSYLHKNLSAINPLRLSIPEGPYMYPFYTQDAPRIRRALQEQKIYIPTLWPDVFARCAPGSIAYDYAMNILPLPVDQRYDRGDMDRMLTALQSFRRS